MWVVYLLVHELSTAVFTVDTASEGICFSVALSVSDVIEPNELCISGSTVPLSSSLTASPRSSLLLSKCCTFC